MKRVSLLQCAFLLFICFSTELFANSPFKILDNCGEQFYDSGGPNGNYQNGENMSWTFCPDQVNSLIRINFTFIDLETCCDNLSIFDGSSTEIPIFIDLIIPATITSTAFDGCLTVTFNSDFSIIGQGWEAEVECIPVPNCFSPGNINSNVVSSTEALVNWNSVNEITSWEVEWGPVSFSQGDGMTVTTNNPFYTITDLEPSSYYDVYVRSVCPNGDFSFWAGPHTIVSSAVCNSDFFDPGGPDNNYPENQNLKLTFCPPSIDQLAQIDFNHVNLHFSDQLNIYNGIGTINPIFFNLFNPQVITSDSPDGCLTVEFISDNVNSFSGWEAKYRCLDRPDCDGPLNISPFSILANSATLTWFTPNPQATWDIEYGPPGFAPGEGTAVILAESQPFILEGLESGTNYEVIVRENCINGGVSLWSQPTFFTTPFSCGDHFYDSGGPDENYGNNEFNQYTFCPDNFDQIIQIIFTEVDIELCCDQIDIFQGLNEFQPVIFDLETPLSVVSESSDGCLIVRFSSSYENTQSGWEANTICVDRPNCQAAFNVSLAESYYDTVRINWSDIPNANMWDIEYGPLGFSLGEGILVENVTEPSIIISDLDPNMEYHFYIRSHCTEGGVSLWSDPFAFWTYFNCSQNFFYDSGGLNENYRDGENLTWTFCPDEANKTMFIDFTSVDILGLCCDHLDIFEGTNLSTPIGLNILEPASFTSYDPNGCLTVRFISDQFSNAQGWTSIVSCITPPTCPDPSLLVAEPISNLHASIDWKSNSTAQQWQVEYGPQNFSIGSGTLLNFTGNPPFEIDNLSPNTTYEFAVRADCGQGDVSNWVRSPVFKTYQGCEDEFTDSGGTFGPYQNDEFNQWVFCPEGETKIVSIDFTAVSVESCCDEISIYNGSGIGDPLLIDLEEPASFTSTAEDGCLTVVFSSDISLTDAGWVANINCLETGVSAITSFQNFQLFPQPTSDQLFVYFHADQSSQHTHFSLLDLTGKTIWKTNKDIQAGKNKMEINLNSFPNGIYFLSIKNFEGTLTKKVIKQ